MVRLMCWLPLVLACGVVVADQPPATLLNLADWKLTLPEDTPAPRSPDEIKQPRLASFVDPRFFFITSSSDGQRVVVFRAPCGADTTKTSKFPRCELREMVPGGLKSAAWSTDDDVVHTLKVTLAVTNTPVVKKHVVCAQIHDAEDDLMMVRLEGTKLFVERNKLGDVKIDDRYVLGTPFRLTIQAGKGKVQVTYNDEPKMDWNVSRDGCYFKTGCYTQSNLSKGDAPDAYGEVTIYDLAMER